MSWAFQPLLPGAAQQLAGGGTADRIRYVNTDSTAGGDGTTNATSGANRAYATMAEMEAAEVGNLVSANERLVVYFSGSVADTTPVDFAGWTTDATRCIRLENLAGAYHSGVWSTSAYRMSASDSRLLTITSADYFEIVGLQFECSSFNNNGGIVYANDNGFPTPGMFRVEQCLFRYTGSAIDYRYARFIESISRAEHFISNNFAYGLLNDTVYPNRTAALYIGYNPTAWVQHNTFKDCAIGIYVEGRSGIRVANNLIQDWQDVPIYPAEASGWATGSDYNISDGTATLPGGNSLDATDVTFTSSTNLHTSDADALVSNNLYSDSDYPTTIDIDGDARPSSGDVFVGGDEDTTPAGYTLTADSGSFALTGQDTALKTGRRLVAEQATFTLAGQAATLTAQRRLVAGQGAFALSGQAGGLLAGRRIAADSGSFSLTGYDASFRKGATLTADYGSFTLSGQTATLTAQRRLTAEHGTFTLTGQSAGLFVGRRLTAEYSSFTLSGQAAGLAVARKITAEHGTFAITGQAATLTAQRRLSAEFGSFALTGQDADLQYAASNNYTLTADHGTFTLTGQDSGLRHGRRLVAANGSFTLTGQDASLKVGRRLSAGHGAFALTGQSAALLWARRLVAEHGAFSLDGQAVGFLRGLLLSAEHGSYTLTGQDIATIRTYILTAGYGAFALTGFDAALSRTINSEGRVTGTGRPRPVESAGESRQRELPGSVRAVESTGSARARSGAGAARFREGAGE